jgi:hypothetical protein
LNNEGALLAYDVRADNGTPDPIFSYPVLNMDLTVDPEEIPLCQEFDLIATVTNRSIYAVNGFTQRAPPESAGEASAARFRPMGATRSHPEAKGHGIRLPDFSSSSQTAELSFESLPLTT